MRGEVDVAALGTTGAPDKDLAATLQDIKKALATVTGQLLVNSKRLTEMEASVSKIMAAQVAPDEWTEAELELQEAEARFLLLKFPQSLRLKVVTEIQNCDKTEAEQQWACLSWKSRLHKVAEFVKTQWEKEKDVSLKEEYDLAIEILTTDLGGEATETSPQKSSTDRPRSKSVQMLAGGNKKVSTSAVLTTSVVLSTDAHMHSIYRNDLDHKASMDDIPHADAQPQQKWFWTDDDNRMCFNLLPTNSNTRMLQGIEFLMCLLILFAVVQLIRKSYHPDEDDTDFEVGTDLMFTVVFSAEYVVRWLAVRPSVLIARPYTQYDFWIAKVKWMVKLAPLIDLLSVLPFYVYWGLYAYGIEDHARALYAIVLLRLVRILKMGKYVHAQQTVVDLIRSMFDLRADLMMFLLVLIIYVTFSAGAMHFLERDANNDEMFDSIPKSMWWAVMTVTTVGYGDAIPVTDWGYFVASVIAIVGTQLMNIPLAIILNAFDEINKSRKSREKRAAAVAERIVQWQERLPKLRKRHLPAKLKLEDLTGDQQPSRGMASKDEMHPVTENLHSYSWDAKRNRLVVTRFGAKVNGKKRQNIHEEKTKRARNIKRLMKDVLSTEDTEAHIISNTVEQALPGALQRFDVSQNTKYPRTPGNSPRPISVTSV